MAAFDRFGRVWLAVTDRRMVLATSVVEPVEAGGVRFRSRIDEAFVIPRGQVTASRRRWLLNPCRLRLDFPDGSWLVLEDLGFWPSRRRIDRIVQALTTGALPD